MTISCPTPNDASEAYRDAYSRINGMVIVGEGLADRHFRRLAALLPEDRDELLRLGAMEARHATDFVGCGRNLGVRPDSGLARRLLMPLHEQFLAAERRGDLVSCLVIQCLLIECFAVAAYRLYLPVERGLVVEDPLVLERRQLIKDVMCRFVVTFERARFT
jgi:fatty aldehyde decarbonylase